MNSKCEISADPAAVFACANSLWEECREAARKDESLDLSSAYHGWDQLMREVMRIGGQFESWACEHVDFEATGEVWPYLLGGRFGHACLEVLDSTQLADFDEEDCLRVAIWLDLPIRSSSKLPVPVDLVAANPVQGGFEAYRIQTVRTSTSEDFIAPFTKSDDPYDPDFSPPYFGVYGLSDGELEHIADRETLVEAISLVKKFAPEVFLRTDY